MKGQNQVCGLVVSGGKSSRMGCDKSDLVYYDKPQKYYVYDLLKKVCKQAIISCNHKQLGSIDKKYAAIEDADEYKHCGPMAALLTAFNQHPKYDFLVVGCDYPFLSRKEIESFYQSISTTAKAAAFFDYNGQHYEPLIAWYSSAAIPELKKLYKAKDYSLQHLLQRLSADKYFPTSTITSTSIDTPEGYSAALDYLRKK